MRILLLQAEFFNALVFADIVLLFSLHAAGSIPFNPQVEEVSEYLGTIPTLLLLLYCTYNALFEI